MKLGKVCTLNSVWSLPGLGHFAESVNSLSYQKLLYEKGPFNLTFKVYFPKLIFYFSELLTLPLTVRKCDREVFSGKSDLEKTCKGWEIVSQPTAK